MERFFMRRGPRRILLVLIVLLVPAMDAAPQAPQRSMTLARPVHPWEFLSAVGTRAALLGNEAGRMEAWVYPLKLLRDFHLEFHAGGQALPAEALARTLVVRPESSTIIYSGDTFAVCETFFVPVNEPGAIVLIDVETEQPLEVEASFVRDFQLEWPAAMGGTYMSWDEGLHAFGLGEETKKFAALIGSPTGMKSREEYQTNYSESRANSFRLGVTQKGKERKVVVMAASMTGRAEAEATYRRLSATYEDLQANASEYYAKYLNQTVGVELPDAQLQQAYDWARVSAVQGMVSNPFLGTGLVAGYRTSGESARPGFAWFFGRDSFWTSLALNAEGDFASARAAIEFISKFQRDDGKIPHEIAQSASLVPWFKDFPYAYVSADATPLYIITTNDYVTRSGDVVFAKEKWDSVWKAYQFMRSTYDDQGLPRNFGIGHGWVEGGPLLPVKTEFYQAGLGAEALRALANLARLAGKDDTSSDLAQEFERQKRRVDETFWLADKKRYAFAVDQDGKPVDEASVLAAVPMWFGLLDEKNASTMISQLADSDHQTDWGMRIISDRAAKFSGGGYHYGSVWPLFTGWASVAEYRYHRAYPAYANLRANSLLALDGSLGHVTEVLSGDYYQPLSTSSPHQIWSAAMVVSPVLRGMFGLSADAKSGTVTFSPHVPADWSSFSIRNLNAGSKTVDFTYSKSLDAITLQVRCGGDAACPIDFEPAVSPRTDVVGVELNGKPMTFHVESNPEDQHVMVRFPASGDSNTLRIRVRNDFGVSYVSNLPALGRRSQELRIVSESWSPSREVLTLEVAGVSDGRYELAVWNPAQIAAVDGAELLKAEQGGAKLAVQFPAGPSDSYSHARIVVQFSTKQSRSKH